MDKFVPKLLLGFFTALGVVLGAALVGSLAALLVGQPPLQTMVRQALAIKLWAIAAAMGGTFSTMEIISQGLFGGRLLVLIRQLLYVIMAFAGAQSACWIVQALAGG